MYKLNKIWNSMFLIIILIFMLVNLVFSKTTAPDTLILGGAVRLNYSLKYYDSVQKDLLGQFGIEVVRMDVNGIYHGLTYSFQHRWYNDFEAIHHAFIDIPINKTNNIQIGIQQVPFGILPYASHSFWFNATYYLGFEDDYDSGIKYIGVKNSWKWQLAFYKNTEYTDDTRMERYSFDLVRAGDQQNSEINQGNFHLSKSISLFETTTLLAGISSELGQIYNHETRDIGNHWAIAVFADMKTDSWNIQLQGIRYDFNPKNSPGISGETIQLGAFGYPFLIQSSADIFSANLAKTLIFKKCFIEKIQMYNDWSAVIPFDTGLKSIQNVTGVLLMRGGLFTYIDLINGYNMWFSGGPGIALKNNLAKWQTRININLGYYF